METEPGGLDDHFQKLKVSRQTPGTFVNLVVQTWNEMPLSDIQNGIDVQKKIHQEVYKKKGAISSYIWSTEAPNPQSTTFNPVHDSKIIYSAETFAKKIYFPEFG